MRAWATVVACELGLPADWLNDGAKDCMQGVSYGPLLIDAPGIKVSQIGSEQLQAMKRSAWRSQQDIDDAATVLADLAGQQPPPWTASIGTLSEPFFAVAGADHPGFTRDLCLNESPGRYDGIPSSSHRTFWRWPEPCSGAYAAH